MVKNPVKDEKQECRRFFLNSFVKVNVHRKFIPKVGVPFFICYLSDIAPSDETFIKENLWLLLLNGRKSFIV